MGTPTFTDREHLTGIIACADSDFRSRVSQILHAADWRAEEAQGGADALRRLGAFGTRMLLLDNSLPDLDAREVAEIVKIRHPQVEVVLMDSQAGRILSDLERLDSEAGYQLRHILRDLVEPVGISTEAEPDSVSELESRFLLSAINPLPGMVGAAAPSPKMASVYRLSRLVAPRTTTVLITGETGTGKELVAKAIHSLSSRANKPFVVVNCAAIPEALLEAELFGYERGSFTGAVQSRAGRIQMARGGTLFLDEVGELPLAMQAKLLRFLQEGEVQRLGSHEVARVDVRVIAATNVHLMERVAAGQFRQDLYYRLSVFPIEVPPLHVRRQDILPLAEHFLEKLCFQAGLRGKKIPTGLRHVVEAYRWPGNVRELQHVIERAFILSEQRPYLMCCEIEGSRGSVESAEPACCPNVFQCLGLSGV